MDTLIKAEEPTESGVKEKWTKPELSELITDGTEHNQGVGNDGGIAQSSTADS